MSNVPRPPNCRPPGGAAPPRPVTDIQAFFAYLIDVARARAVQRRVDAAAYRDGLENDGFVRQYAQQRTSPPDLGFARTSIGLLVESELAKAAKYDGVVSMGTIVRTMPDSLDIVHAFVLMFKSANLGMMKSDIEAMQAEMEASCISDRYRAELVAKSVALQRAVGMQSARTETHVLMRLAVDVDAMHSLAGMARSQHALKIRHIENMVALSVGTEDE